VDANVTRDHFGGGARRLVSSKLTPRRQCIETHPPCMVNVLKPDNPCLCLPRSSKGLLGHMIFWRGEASLTTFQRNKKASAINHTTRHGGLFYVTMSLRYPRSTTFLPAKFDHELSRPGAQSGPEEEA
jgi:hypothetical protein